MKTGDSDTDPTADGRPTSNHKKLILLVGTMLTGVLVAALIYPHNKRIGGLSLSDRVEIRIAVIRSLTPWQSFRYGNRDIWQHNVRVWRDFRIDALVEDSISTTLIRPDGTKEGPFWGATVRFSTDGNPKATCRVENRNGRWIVPPPELGPKNREFFFLPANERPELNAAMVNALIMRSAKDVWRMKGITSGSMNAAESRPHPTDDSGLPRGWQAKAGQPRCWLASGPTGQSATQQTWQSALREADSGERAG